MKTKKPKRGKLWRVGMWGNLIVVELEEAARCIGSHAILVRAHSPHAAARVYIRGNLEHDMAIATYELDNPGNPEATLAGEFLASRRYFGGPAASIVRKSRIRQFGYWPRIVVLKPRESEPAAEQPPRKEWRRKGWGGRIKRRAAQL